MRSGLRRGAIVAGIVVPIAVAALAQRPGRISGQVPGAAPAAVPAPRQSVPSGPVIQLHATTRVVEIDVTAEGANGQPADNLKPSDFAVFDNGHPRPFTIFSFNPETAAATAPALPALGPATPPGSFSNMGAAPRLEAQHSAVLLVDAFNGWFENFDNARKAVVGALNKLPPDERIALYVIDRYKGMQLLVDYTTDRARLRQAITHYTPGGTCPAPPGEEAPGDATRVIANTGPPRPEDAYWNSPDPAAEAKHYAQSFSHSPCQGSPADRAGYAVMRDGAESVRLALVALASSLESLPGRKSVFWITEGFPPDMLQNTYLCACANEWKAAFDQLNDANVAVSTLDSNGIAGPPRLWGPGGVLVMQQVSATTGGQTYYQDADLSAALSRGIDSTRNSYTLGFYVPTLDGTYHTLKVAVDRPGVTLTYRRGYYDEDDSQRAAANKTSDLSAALLNPAGETGVGITAWVKPQPAGRALDGLEVIINLDPSTLTVQGDNHGGWLGQVDELFVERNAAGLELGRESDSKSFQMTARERSQVERDGLNLQRTLRLAPGVTQIEVVIRDHDSGRIGSLAVPLGAPSPAVK